MSSGRDQSRGEPDLAPVAVFVPVAGDPLRAIVDAGSGVVGTAHEQGRTVVDYEGNRYAAANLKTWSDRVNIAWSRHSLNYPTVARATVRPEAVVHVGWYDPRTGDVTVDPEHTDTVAQWLGIEAGDLPEQLLSSSAKHQTRRALLEMRADPARRREADLLARRMHIEL